MSTQNKDVFILSFFIGAVLSLFLLVSPVSAFYFDHDPDDPAENAPFKEGEKAVIPLDTKDPGYNLWQTPRDDLM